MSVLDFIKEPYKYTKSHYVIFSHQSAATSPAAAGMQELARNQRQGWVSVHYAPSPGNFTTFVFANDFVFNEKKGHGEHARIGRKGMHMLECRPHWTEQGIRFLPWVANGASYMSLDASARKFFTGPLSGCSIYIVEDTATQALWALHVNRNDVAGQNNQAIKHAMMADTCFSDMGIGARIRYEALYQREYLDNGFVFGEKTGNLWKFYAVDTSSHSSPFTQADFAAGKKPPPVTYQTKVKELSRA